MLASIALLMGACSQSPAPQATAPTMPEPSTTSPAVPETQDGEERLASEAEVQEAQARLAALTVEGPLESQTASSVRADGTLMAGGGPFFPLGFYHLAWAAPAERRERDMHAIADLGFNTMLTTMFDPVDAIPAFRKLLRGAHGRGMRLIVEDVNSVSVEALKNEPGLLGWAIADDCNALVTPAELQRRHAARKALDPAHFTYGSLAVSYSNSWSEYFGKSDLMGNQAYPVGGGDALSTVYGTMKILVREAVARGTAPIANLQTFRWDGSRLPNVRELYNMTSQALGAGVKGVMYYTYLDQANDLSGNAAYHSELKTAAAEIKLLSPVLLHGTRTEVLGGGELRAVHWSYAGKRYLQVISVNEASRSKASFRLPAAAKTLTPLFSRRPTGLKVQADRQTVTGKVSSLAVHWYEVR